MFSSAPKQLLKAEENGLRHHLKPATFLQLSRSYSELGQHGFYLQTRRVQATHSRQWVQALSGKRT